MNLATFVTTYMEDDAEEVFKKTWNVNGADASQYPSCQTMEKRCVAMLSNLYHSPASKPCGAATVGCTEACLLSGLAAKKLWQRRRRASGKSTERPNLVVGAHFQVCWKKFCVYFDVEMRAVPVREDYLVLDPKDVPQHVDENTIGVVSIFGSTYNGQFEDVKALDAVVEDLNQKNGWELPILVDAASGGFVAPFLYPDLVWDFQLKNVHSICVSGHKYGMVYPGIGWIIYRDESCLPDDMVLTTSYLGKPEPTMTINFSRNAAQVAASYFNFIRLGRMGYTLILENLLNTAKRLGESLEKTGHFRMVNEPTMPVVAFSLTKVDGKDRVYDEYDVMFRIREYRWMLPAYSCPENAKNIKLLRAVIRLDVTLEMVDDLAQHLQDVVEWLDMHYEGADPAHLKKIKERFHKVEPDAEMGL
ncbi:glutamate decarboxylase [Coccomyxa subellipsoidea C-169]|uniref:Glutamate decarboxylase n=1 Tax=Coccomyxa subellipsoidea (strain C-169) TaxID=574566 RepID=I0YMW8_COCSC|nr:glutamate decarboxylase [Coccomyxa subellipsoidea C-169]EIE19737.1 glutamate decarboxylase [Coccomyxa subellipsoidea C-169]|eukprot:XP_005644281.1 glutamate decarboxylase [Coccomyxa subellipsoidea C-169]